MNAFVYTFDLLIDWLRKYVFWREKISHKNFDAYLTKYFSLLYRINHSKGTMAIQTISRSRICPWMSMIKNVFLTTVCGTHFRDWKKESFLPFLASEIAAAERGEVLYMKVINQCQLSTLLEVDKWRVWKEKSKRVYLYRARGYFLENKLSRCKTYFARTDQTQTKRFIM